MRFKIFVQVKLAVDDGPKLRVHLRETVLGNRPGAVAAELWRKTGRIGGKNIEVFLRCETPGRAFPCMHEIETTLLRGALFEIGHRIVPTNC